MDYATNDSRTYKPIIKVYDATVAGTLLRSETEKQK